MLSEIFENKYFMISFICGFKKYNKFATITKKKETDSLGEQISGYRWVE